MILIMQVVLSDDATKQYKRLPKPDQIKVKKKLLLLVNNPYIGKKLGGEFVGIYSLRAWPYRILYGVNEQEKKVEIHKIKHRQGAYN